MNTRPSYHNPNIKMHVPFRPKLRIGVFHHVTFLHLFDSHAYPDRIDIYRLRQYYAFLGSTVIVFSSSLDGYAAAQHLKAAPEENDMKLSRNQVLAFRVP